MTVKISISIEFSESLKTSMSKIFDFFEHSIERAVTAFAKYISVSMISINENDSFIDVNVINVAAFSRLTKKKNHALKAFSLKNVKKTLSIKLKSNSATLI